MHGGPVWQGRYFLICFVQIKSTTEGAIAKHCKVFETRLRSLVSTYRVLPLNEEQSTKPDVAGFITERIASGKNTLEQLTLVNFKTLLLLEIQLLLGCYVE